MKWSVRIDMIYYLKNIILILSFFSISLYPNIGISQDLYEIYMNSQSHKPYVIFAAREGTPGHAFIILGEELDNGFKWNKAIFGFYPKNGKKIPVNILYGAPGEISSRWEDLSHDISYKIYLTDEKVKEVMNIYFEWSDKMYSAFSKNCNKFASEIAIVLGLTLPEEDPGYTFPINYIKKLREVNNWVNDVQNIQEVDVNETPPDITSGKYIQKAKDDEEVKVH